MKRELVLDIHGLTVDEAYLLLLETLESLPEGTKKLTVVHGYNGGKFLQNLVRNDFYHWRIVERIAPYYNDGETVYILKGR